MTPFEALAKRKDEGWQPVIAPPEMLPYLFMPHEQIKVRRERFTLRGNTYHACELCNYHGHDDLIAAYDIHDAAKVWVLDPEERLICQATWKGNRVHARPISQVEQAVMEREARRVKNLENKMELVRSESESAIEVPVNIELSAEFLEAERKREEREQQEMVTLAEARRYRDVNNSVDVYYMIKDREKEGSATDYQLRWKDAYEHWEDTTKKVSPFKDDPYCLNDPDDEKVSEKQNDSQ
jgi:putative transposase